MRPGYKTCEVCGGAYRGGPWVEHYCSNDCRNKVRREKAKAQREELARAREIIAKADRDAAAVNDHVDGS